MMKLINLLLCSILLASCMTNKYGFKDDCIIYAKSNVFFSGYRILNSNHVEVCSDFRLNDSSQINIFDEYSECKILKEKRFIDTTSFFIKDSVYIINVFPTVNSEKYLNLVSFKLKYLGGKKFKIIEKTK